MNTNFDTLAHIIRTRRTVKATAMNGQQIPAGDIDQLLLLADHAPTHGRTEPWRFLIYTGDALQQFCKDHAQLYWAHTPEEVRTVSKRDNLMLTGEKASHLIIVTMQRTSDTRIPMMEEYAATAAAVQNMLLGAEALNIAAIWSTGGMALKPEMKALLHLQEEDQVVGFIYLGYTNDPKREAMRRIPIDQKVHWV